jgi:hypothetical protein
MTVGAVNVTRNTTSVLDAARTRLASWRRRDRVVPQEGHRPPAGVDLVDAATDELARDPHVRSVDCKRVDVSGASAVEILVVPADADCISGARSACEQMAHLISPLTQQEGLDVRFRLAAPPEW